MASITWASDAGGAVAESDFDEMFPDLFRAAYRVVYRLLGSREDAADCAQGGVCPGVRTLGQARALAARCRG